ncbi:hypothetical protein [Vreelandella neptunia]|uniref:DUF2254 domain-containing protein n=1 Tax=Vreelandella neptunia TaxID=115551 RepID=A0ABS9S2U4_9GAMM|nr:hypothetical protein [Halomonas neptunia]MCH4810427.1 hypothetical protein [Halomonas neptunia]
MDRIKIWAMSKQWFWKSRTRLEKTRFFFEANIYKHGNSISKARTNVNILINLAWIGLKSLFWVAFSLGTLICIESYVRNNMVFLKPLTNLDKDYNIEQLRLYAQLLTAIFSIYFATIGIILSSGYTRLRSDIIQLLTNEQIGSVFARVLVFSATFSLTATSLPLFGIDPGYFIYFAATFLTLASSLTLFPLGQRLFNFFNLNLLVRSEILPNIAKHIEGAAKTRNSASLANHHSRAARMALEQLCYLDDRVKTDKEGMGDNLPALTNDYSRLLLHYLHQKHKIKQDSYWFPRKQNHQQWFFAGDSATSSALQTSSQLSVEEKIDLNWFESEIIKRLSRHIELAFEEGDIQLALNLISCFSVRTATYAKEFQFDLGMQEIYKIRGLIETAFASKRVDAVSDEEKIWIAIADAWAVLGSNLCLETLRRMITFEKELGQFFLKDVWSANSLHSLPAFFQAELSFIVKRISFELAIEGRRLSRPKYVQQLAVQKILQSYKKILQQVCEFFEKIVPEFIESLIKLGFSQAATQVALASLHFHWKLPRWLEEVSQLLERYTAYTHYLEKQYTFPEIDVKGMAGSLVKVRDQTFEILGNPDIVGHIFSAEHDDGFPDHFGQVYFELTEECIHALEENNEEKFGKIFPMFFNLAILASDSKFADPKLEVNDEFRLHLISTVINDLASVLGFATLYGAYFDNPKLLDVAIGKFMTFIERVDNKQQYLKRMILLSNPNSFSWCASPRGMIRMNWKIAFENRARHDGYGHQMSFGEGKAHYNKLVNEFLKSHSDASHLFFAIHVLPFLGTDDFKIDHRITSIARKLREEEAED